MIHAQPATFADFLMHAGVFLPKTVKEPYHFWFFVMPYNALQPKLMLLTGMLPTTVLKVDPFLVQKTLDTKIKM